MEPGGMMLELVAGFRCLYDIFYHPMNVKIWLNQFKIQYVCEYLLDFVRRLNVGIMRLITPGRDG